MQLQLKTSLQDSGKFREQAIVCLFVLCPLGSDLPPASLVDGWGVLDNRKSPGLHQENLTEPQFPHTQNKRSHHGHRRQYRQVITQLECLEAHEAQSTDDYTFSDHFSSFGPSSPKIFQFPSLKNLQVRRKGWFKTLQHFPPLADLRSRAFEIRVRHRKGGFPTQQSIPLPFH